MRKWTLRIDDELADIFTELCDAAGITIQAALEAGVKILAERHRQNDGLPIDEWAEMVPTPATRWQEMARALDASRRRPTRD